MKENELINGFTKIDSKRIGGHLRTLLPHLKPNKFVIVGGLAIRYHLAQNDINYPRKLFNDLDIIAEHPSVVLPTVTSDFFISHYHRNNENSFYIVLIDPKTKTKVDIFDYEMAPEQTINVDFDGQSLKLVSIEDQLVKTVFDIQRISSQSHVDPKQFLDTRLLMQIADMKRANLIWQRRNFKMYPRYIVEAIEKAQKIAEDHPEWIQEKPFYKPKPYKCNECINLPQFPLTPMEKIYKIMGYIE